MTLLGKCLLGVISLVFFLGGSVEPNAGNTLSDERPAPAWTAQDKAAAVKGMNAFALDLYGRLKDSEGNLFFSPESISMALAMTYAGARGQTAEEMAATLHFDLDQQHLHPALGALLHGLNGKGKKRGYQLSMANALWGQKGYHFLPEFLKLDRDNYGAGINEVNFAPDPEEARQIINAWVAKHTQDKIIDLLPSGILNAMTRLVLTNAVYFKGDWQLKFKKEATKKAPFLTGGPAKSEVPLMHQTDHFGYFEGDDFQTLELPYAGKELSMVVFLPKKIDGLPAFEKRLTASSLSTWLGKLRERAVQVYLPKFKETSKFSLKDTLSAMGMTRAFTATQADFSGMDGTKELYISAVVHQAFVDVNEQGTEAAAATAVTIRPLSAVPSKISTPPIFRADHPFVFLIRDRQSGSILFMGRLVDPK